MDHMFAHFGRQLQQTQRIGDVRAALADNARHSILCPAKLFHQLGIGIGLFHRVQIGPLDVFDNADFQHLDIVHFTDNDRHRNNSRGLRCTPATLTGNDLVVTRLARLRTHEDGQKHTLVADRRRQFVQIFFFENLTRLIRIGLQLLDRNAIHARRGRKRCIQRHSFLCIFSQQGRKAPTQTALTFRHDAYSVFCSYSQVALIRLPQFRPQ